MMNITIKLDNKKIKIAQEVIDLMNSYKQLAIMDYEAGGILIGRENIETGNIVIEYATAPYSKDERTRTLFHRKDKKHIEFFQRLYKENSGIYAYIGEWHTHPEDYPNYSSKDINNWRKIARKDDDKQKVFYHIIVGIKEIRVWAYSNISKVAERIY